MLQVRTAKLTRSSINDRAPLTQFNSPTAERRVPVVTLDSVVSEYAPPPPYVLKIDTEGHELEVLRGAEAALGQTTFVITETSIRKRFESSYDFMELVAHMRQRGFEIGNVLEAPGLGRTFVRRLDLLFVRADMLDSLRP